MENFPVCVALPLEYQHLHVTLCVLASAWKHVHWSYRRPLDASSLAEGSVRTSRAGDQVSLKFRLVQMPHSFQLDSGLANQGLSPRVRLCTGAFVVFGDHKQGRHMERRLNG